LKKPHAFFFSNNRGEASKDPQQVKTKYTDKRGWNRSQDNSLWKEVKRMVEIELPIPLEEAENRVPAGTFLAAVESWKRSQFEEKPAKLVFTFVVLEADHEGAKMTTTITLSEKALWKLAQLARACGRRVEGDRIDPDMLLGRRLRIVVEESEYQGLPQSQVVRFLPEGSGENRLEAED